MIGGRRSGASGSLERLLAETRDLVGRLLRENRRLRARNLRLEKQLDRVSQSWAELRKLLRSAPRRRSR